jgi:UDP-glucose:(heptosyl)LPS alpha-1,3-glucosyltransferase
LKFAFLLYKFFPYGGLQRDFVRIARECQARGHQVRVYTLVWEGEVPDDFDVTIVPVTALFNHTKYQYFTEWVNQELVKNSVDCVVGFNKMPGLDIYYAADSCYEEKVLTQRDSIYRLLPRYHHFSHYERAVFSQTCDTEILMISNSQKPFFEKHYGTPEERMYLLPPGISRDRIAPPDAEQIRHTKRMELGIEDDQVLIIFVGSGFIKKGLDRAIHAIDSLTAEQKQNCKFLIIGEDRKGPFERQIERLELGNVIQFEGGKDDVPAYLLAADLLLHPASDENAGMVLLEALVAGLPVLATDVCGYAHYIEEADMGDLVGTPFHQDELNQKLSRLIQNNDREKYRQNGAKFAQTADIYSLPQVSVDVIEAILEKQETCVKPKIAATAAIITLNEEKNIEACIKSIEFFEEVLVIDSGSTDNTVAIAESMGARVIKNPWPGYSDQRKFALEHAHNDWIFSIDADERISAELRMSISEVFEKPVEDVGYLVNRRNHFMGRALHHGEGYPDWLLRMFKRTNASWSSDSVHEKVQPKGKVRKLQGDLNHYSEDSLNEYLAKQNRYTRLQAEQMWLAGKRCSTSKLITSPTVRFLKFYLFRLGFLDGLPGLVHICLGCMNSFIKYAKLKEIQNKGFSPALTVTPMVIRNEPQEKVKASQNL